MKGFLKRGVAAAMCITTAIFMLAGCGKDNQPSDTQEGSVQEEAEDSGENQGEVSSDEIAKIVMTFPTGGVEPTDLGLVEAYVNEIAREKIGVEVEFKPVSLFEAGSQIPMWIGGKEQIDLMFVAFADLSPYVTQNMILPIEDYIEAYAPRLKELAENGDPIYGEFKNTGHVYGVSVMDYQQGISGGYIISAEDLEAAELSYENGQQITLDDLDLIFEKIKAVKPDTYPCGVLGSVQRSGMTMISDTLGATTASGVIIGLDSTEVVNYYETEEYQNFLKHVRSWYEKGYILKDAATTDFSLAELLRNGTISGYFNEPIEGLRAQEETNAGKALVNLKLVDNFQPSISPTSGTKWAVPVTSADPEAAVKFLNLIYEDSEVYNTMMWGIEGTHWKFIDKENGVIDYADGLTHDTTPYAYGIGLFGDGRMHYYMGSRPDQSIIDGYVATAASRRTKGYGFAYDATAMTGQINAVEAVIMEYAGALETGSADLEPTYQEFINKLKANGIDEIIADKQAQLDAWLAQQ